MRLLIVFCLFWLTGSSMLLAAEQQVAARLIQQDQGRDFGVLVGDIIRHHYIIDAQQPYAIIQSSLPRPGDLNYWLTLRDVEIKQQDTDNISRYRIDLTYQTFYAPLDVRALTIPAIPIDFSAAEKRFHLSLPEWRFTMSPIKEITPSGVGNDNRIETFMKPAIEPQAISLSTTDKKLWWLGLASAFLILCLLWLNGFLPQVGQSGFGQAARKIRRIQRHERNRSRAALHCLQLVHEAINQRAQKTIFADQLSNFIGNHPQFEQFKPDLEFFYKASREAFFLDNKPNPATIETCLKLCRQMAAADKVSGH